MSLLLGETQLAVFVWVCFWALMFVCSSATNSSDKVSHTLIELIEWLKQQKNYF